MKHTSLTLLLALPACRVSVDCGCDSAVPVPASAFERTWSSTSQSPFPWRVDRERRVELTYAPVSGLAVFDDGSAWLTLGPLARIVHVDPELTATSDGVLSLARRSLRTGAPVHGTLARRREPRFQSASQKGPPPVERWILVRLAETPDPASDHGERWWE